MEPMNLVIVESGSRRKAWHELNPVEPPMMVLIQEPSESPTGFAARVLWRLRRLWAHGARLGRVVLIGEDTVDPPTVGARLALLREIRAREPAPGARNPVSLDLQ